MGKYFTLNFPSQESNKNGKTLLTGIREKCSKGERKYYISGFYEPNETDAISFIVKGSLRELKKGKGKWTLLNFHHKKTNLYGPNLLDYGNLSVVGNYFLNNYSIGCLYEGKLDSKEKGKWTIIIPPNDTTINTICHSNMGGLVVGNYETTNEMNRSQAFIYDICNGNYYNIVKEGVTSISAYGIWYHEHKDFYTICGGYIINLKTVAYLVDWNNKDKKLSNWREFIYNDDAKKNFSTHFDGISYNNGEYYLTGDYIEIGNPIPQAFFYKKKKWYPVKYPLAEVTSGNSVAENIVIGVYKMPQNDAISGYVAIF